jgi:hypothetical protein
MLYKVFPGRNPVAVVQEIANICMAYRVQVIVGDAGEGHMPNSQLGHLVGSHKVHQLQYLSQKKALVWNKIDRFTGDRTMLIDNYFMLLKKGGIIFAKREQMITAFDDILNEYEEVTLQGKKVWRHSPQKPDDCLHAGLLGWIASKIVQNDLKFYQ